MADSHGHFSGEGLHPVRAGKRVEHTSYRSRTAWPLGHVRGGLPVLSTGLIGSIVRHGLFAGDRPKRR